MKVKKIISLFLSAVMAVTAAATLAVGASAADIKELESGEQYSYTFSQKGETVNYKINVSKAGTLKVAFSTGISALDFSVTNSSDRILGYSEKNVELGSVGSDFIYGFQNLKYNSIEKKFKGTLSYKVEKGTYYINLRMQGTQGTSKVTFKPVFPSDKKAETTTTATITSFVLPMKVGDTIILGTDLSDTKQTITWKSSKTSVATVSKKGKITAKAAGTATITATVGSTVLKIKVKVTK